MRSASSAEWLIARFTERSRAASIVGDLFEDTAQHGKLRFWLAVSGVLISLTWRRAVGFVAALYLLESIHIEYINSKLYLGFYSVGALQTPIYRMHPLYTPPHGSVSFFSLFMGLGIILWIAAPYSAIRFGLKDSFAQIAMALCGLLTIVAFLWWIPVVAAGCGLLAALILIISIASAERRRALVGLAVTLALGFSGGLFAKFLSGAAYPPGERMDWPFASGLALLNVAVVTTACANVHRYLVRRDRKDAELLLHSD